MNTNPTASRFPLLRISMYLCYLFGAITFPISLLSLLLGTKLGGLFSFIGGSFSIMGFVSGFGFFITGNICHLALELERNQRQIIKLLEERRIV